jgi:hypothetical protein
MTTARPQTETRATQVPSFGSQASCWSCVCAQWRQFVHRVTWTRYILLYGGKAAHGEEEWRGRMRLIHVEETQV